MRRIFPPKNLRDNKLINSWAKLLEKVLIRLSKVQIYDLVYFFFGLRFLLLPMTSKTRKPLKNYFKWKIFLFTIVNRWTEIIIYIRRHNIFISPSGYNIFSPLLFVYCPDELHAHSTIQTTSIINPVNNNISSYQNMIKMILLECWLR